MKLKHVGILFVMICIAALASWHFITGNPKLCPDAEQTIYDMKIKAMSNGFSTIEYDAVSVRIDLTEQCFMQKLEASKLCTEIYFAQLDALSGIGNR